MYIIIIAAFVCTVFFFLSRRHAIFKFLSPLSMVLTLFLCLRSIWDQDPELQEALQRQGRELAASDRFLGTLVAQRHPSQEVLVIVSPAWGSAEVETRCANFRQGLGTKGKFLAVDAPGGIGSQEGKLFLGFSAAQIEEMHRKYPRAQTLVLLTRMEPGPCSLMDEDKSDRPSLILQDSWPADFADEIRKHLVDLVSARISSPDVQGDSDAEIYQREHLIVDATNIDKLAKSRPELEIASAEEKVKTIRTR
ncbi:MAG: hypothetical protein RL095_4178 [Verrucomicrobiota bacterium]|jgi:hypothetical protein